MLLGFGFAAYSVVANDSVQTLGTFIASNSRKYKWYTLWTATSFVLIVTLVVGWYLNDGDISYGRLDLIPLAKTFKWYHAFAPLTLVFLTRLGIPVSTTFLVLSVFASSVVLEDMLIKSFLGYGVAMVAAFISWKVLSTFLDEHSPVSKVHEKLWVVIQWITTAVLWSTWLSHDLANIAVFLPRELSVYWMVICIIVLVTGLGYMFYNKGGKIQNIVLEKTGTRYIRSASIIDFFYALILLVFREISNVPMSTTWVFVGLLAGREFAIQKQVFPVVAKDFSKMMIGLAVSVVIVWVAKL
jgi:hypothetical protein